MAATRARGGWVGGEASAVTLSYRTAAAALGYSGGRLREFIAALSRVETLEIRTEIGEERNRKRTVWWRGKIAVEEMDFDGDGMESRKQFFYFSPLDRLI
jgi:hypothetical protein